MPFTWNEAQIRNAYCQQCGFILTQIQWHPHFFLYQYRSKITVLDLHLSINAIIPDLADNPTIPVHCHRVQSQSHQNIKCNHHSENELHWTGVPNAGGMKSPQMMNMQQWWDISRAGETQSRCTATEAEDATKVRRTTKIGAMIKLQSMN